MSAAPEAGSQTRRSCFLGTAGWSLPRAWRDRFPGEGSHLERYAAVFGAVEIDSSFYRPHRRATYERWAAATPATFRFAVKAPKTTTHLHGADASAALDAFFAEIAGLGAKCGPILVQLPPKREFAPADAAALLSAFRARTPGPIALEARHFSWWSAEADELLARLEIAGVAADPPRTAGGDRPRGAKTLAYFRLHGSPEIYRSAYGAARLPEIAAEVGAAAQSGAQTWCIFDNTASGAAMGDALDLQQRLARADGAVRDRVG